MLKHNIKLAAIQAIKILTPLKKDIYNFEELKTKSLSVHVKFDPLYSVKVLT